MATDPLARPRNEFEDPSWRIGETRGDWHRVSQVEFEYRPLIESADPAQLAMELEP